MVAILFHRLGPYHVARLRAAAELGPVVAIELFSETNEYAWAKVEGDEPFRRVTLFQENDSRCAPPGELGNRLEKLLTELAPKAVAVPGWWDQGSLCALQWCGENAVPAIVMSESTEFDEPRSWWKEAIKRQIVGLCSAALVGGNPHANYIAKLGPPPAPGLFLDTMRWTMTIFPGAPRRSGIGRQKSEKNTVCLKTTFSLQRVSLRKKSVSFA